jgi:hypothetical protein
MKHRLDIEQISDNFFESTRILGISTSLKNYQLCYHIEKSLQINFQTSVDLQIPLEKNRRSYSFTVYEFFQTSLGVEHFLYSNKNDGESFLPELPHLDFIWLIKGDYYYIDQNFLTLQNQLKIITGVQLVTEVPQNKIKSRDNLQL